jgi:hypothetical protein
MMPRKWACACRKLNPGILVMHSARDWATKNVRAAHDRLEPQALEGDRPRKTRASRRASPAAQALRSDVVRRAASRGGTLRCAEARRVAYRDVDKSYASHRLRQNMAWSRGDFKTTLLPYRLFIRER